MGEQWDGRSGVRNGGGVVAASFPLTTFLSGDGSGLLAVLGEPGMGKSAFLGRIADAGRSQGLEVFQTELGGMEAVEAGGALTRIVSNANRARRTSEVLVCIDDVPASDEVSGRKMAQAIKKMLSAGCRVVLTMLPECRTVLELLPAVTVLEGSDLLVREGGRDSTPGAIYALRRLQGLGLDGKGKSLMAQQDALRFVVAGALRGGLMDEEERIRLAMVLLGEGDEARLVRVLGRCDGELVWDISMDAPFFGVDPGSGRFRCVALEAPSDVATCFSILRDVSQGYPDVCVACARELGESGDYPRMAMLCEMLGDDPRMLRLAQRWGAQLLDLGRSGMVRRAFETLGQGGLGQDEASLAAAVRAVSERGCTSEWTELSQGVISGGRDGGDEASGLLIAVRFALSRRVSPPQRESTRILDARLGLHLKVVDLLLAGDTGTAFELLAARLPAPDSQGASNSLLRLDMEAVRLAEGERPVDLPSVIDAACDTLQSPEYAGLETYPRLLRAWREAVVGDDAGSDVDTLITRTERLREGVAHACALLIGTVRDLREGSYSRATVRASFAREAFCSLDLMYMGDVTCILLMAARAALDEREGALSELGWKWSNDDTAGVAKLLARAIDGRRDADSAYPTCLPEEAPRGLRWLLLVLSDCDHAFASRLRSGMPRHWGVAISGIRDRLDVERGPLQEGREDLSMAAACPMRVSLLGDFSVEVRGRLVPEKVLEKRRAKSVLVYLLLMRYRRAKRYQIVDQVFPECDYETGRRRVYQATNVIRDATAAVVHGLDPLLTVREDQSLAVRPEVVSCDVDEFLSLARRLVDAVDDGTAVALARRVEEIYQGDLFIPPKDATGYVADMRERLRTLYADAMVSGAEAALREGQARTASRFAENAMLIDELREDAVIVLIRALRECGRTTEAERRYQRYTRKLVQTSRRPPSKRVRLAALGSVGGPMGHASPSSGQGDAGT